jgi:hypothetical protein
LLSFFIPFINVSQVLEKSEIADTPIVSIIPSLNQYTTALQEASHCPVPIWSTRYDKWGWMAFIVITGAVLLFIRFGIRFLSFLRLKRKSTLVYDKTVRLYQVDENIIPFSFGNAVFINSGLHSETELQEIIRHEFIHVRQRHTMDIIWGEILCMTNWYNPFAWLLRHSIRQNLEFIADDKALEHGIDKKQYQYLLLKVIGNKHFSIAHNFNFSSLKKRIAMMNKLKSARVHLVKFLFVLPMLAVLLLAFRGRWKPGETDEKVVRVAGLVVDAATRQPVAGASITCSKNNLSAITDEHGFYLLKIPYGNEPLHFSLVVNKNGYTPIHQQENWGNFEDENVRDLYANTFEFFGLGKNATGSDGFSALAGRSLSASDLNNQEANRHFRQVIIQMDNNGPVYNDTIPENPEPNSKGYIIEVSGWNSNARVTVKDKDNKIVERVDYDKWKDNEKFYEDKYGELPPPPPPPVPPVPPTPPKPIELPANVSKIDVNEKRAKVVLKDGSVENFDLSKPEEKAKFEKKYGEIMPPPPPLPPVPPKPARRGSTSQTSMQNFLDRNPEIKDVGWVFNNSHDNIPVIIHLGKKDGTTEEYRLDRPADMKRATGKYGKLPEPATEDFAPDGVQVVSRRVVGVSVDPIVIRPGVQVTEAGRQSTESNRSPKINPARTKDGHGVNSTEGALIPPVDIEPGTGHTRTIIAPMSPTNDGWTLPDQANLITGKEDVLVVITNKTTREQLDGFIEQMKEKGIELSYDDIDYRNGKLVSISGKMKSKDGHSNFVATDFNKLVLATLKQDGRTYFKVLVTDNRKIVI